MHFKVTTHSSYQTIHNAFPTTQGLVVQFLNLKLISIAIYVNHENLTSHH